MKRILLSAAAILLLYSGCMEKDPGIADVGGALEKSFPNTILLPEGFAPEGITTGRGTTFYVGSLATGEIFRGDYRTGEGEVFVEASSRIAVGLKFDERSGYLFVAGAGTGFLYVYDGSSGELIEQYPVPGSIMINDVIVTRDAVYATESLAPVYYKLELGPGGSLIPSAEVEVIELSGDYEFLEITPNPFGINNNGIEATPNGKYLIIGNMADGKLYRVDPETGHADLIDIETPLSDNDGLVLQNHTLYVVQNLISQISVVKLDPDLLSGDVVDVITDPGFEVPATAALFGNSLYSVNARFTLPPGPYYIVKTSR